MSHDNGQQKSWRQTLDTYRDGKVVALFFLGLSSGLPYLLVFSTLSAWLRDAGINRAVIGYFSWVGITYSIKVFWAPIVDRVSLPLLSKQLGRRRSWILLAQYSIALGLLGMSLSNPIHHISQIVAYALLIAFASATQDICIDAFRIEAVSEDKQAAIASTYVFGYRIALLIAGAGALYMADYLSWSLAYSSMAFIMVLCMICVLCISEPCYVPDQGAYLREQRVLNFLARAAHLPNWQRHCQAWFIGAVICPFTDFFLRYKRQAILILILVGLYKISDITMGIMANPFYLDLGFSKTQIATVTKIFGLCMTLFGTLLGGVLATRFGMMRILLLGAVLVAASNLCYMWLALTGPNMMMLALTISAENISSGLASAVFIAYLSHLTSKHYTATQYALFSSLMTLPGKLISGFSGVVVNAVGYASFFAYTALIGVPGIVLILYLSTKQSSEALNSAISLPALGED